MNHANRKRLRVPRLLLALPLGVLSISFTGCGDDLTVIQHDQQYELTQQEKSNQQAVESMRGDQDVREAPVASESPLVRGGGGR